MNKRCYIAILLCVPMLAYGEQSCNANMHKSTPLSDFEFIENGKKVRSLVTGLIWHRCYYGQVFNHGGTASNTEVNDDTCDGSPSLLNWRQALDSAKSLSVTDPGARLPNIKELNSITEYQCIEPAFNTSIFPPLSVMPAEFSVWSSTPVYGVDDSIWVADFKTGGSNFKPLSRQAYVRVVELP